MPLPRGRKPFFAAYALIRITKAGEEGREEGRGEGKGRATAQSAVFRRGWRSENRVQCERKARCLFLLAAPTWRAAS